MSRNFLLETGTTRALWDLFGSSGPWRVALEALADQLPADDPRVQSFLARAASGFMSMAPRHTPCPDLMLVSPAGEGELSEIFAVIEVKTGANTNWSGRAGAAELPQLAGPVAAEITDYYFGPDQSAGTTICQTDLYRSRQWWREVDLVHADTPEDVLWLLFDSKGRSTETALSDSARSDAWITVDLKQFAARLRELRPVRALRDQDRDIIAVVLWHLDQSPGKNLTVTTSMVPQTSVSIDDLVDEEGDAPALAR